MNNSSDHHEPTAEFRAQLRRDISRAVRSDEHFGPPPAVHTRRLALAFGIAAGVVLTLATGMILGASASYAAAAPLSAPRSPLAIFPIKSALYAIGCGTAPVAPQATRTPQTARAAPPAQQVVPVVEQTPPLPAPRSNPDRARIAALATQHQAAVVRGDTAAEYIVMVLDAADEYVWSTIGSGNLSIEVAGDPRTPAERAAYNRQHQAEYWGPAGAAGSKGKWVRFEFGLAGRMDSLAWLHSGYVARLDSFVLRKPIVLVKPGADGGGGGGARGGGGGARGGSGGSDSLAFAYRFALTPGAGAGARGAGGGARGGGGSNVDSATPGTYTNGWAGTRNGPLFNQASGLEDPTPGQSGIQGLLSTSVSSAETYSFPAGELAPHVLKIMVVHLTPRTVWKGR